MIFGLSPEIITLFTLSSAAIAVIGCFIAACTDIKWGIVPDKLNYSLIAVGIILVPLRFEIPMVIAVYGLALLVFLIGLLAYTFGQLGGGDVKLFSALTLLIPFYPDAMASLSPYNVNVASLVFNLPYLGVSIIPPFIVSVFFISALMAVFFVSIHYIYRLWKDRKEIESLGNMTFKGIALAVLVAVTFSVLWMSVNPNMILIIPPIALGAFLLPFKDTLLTRYIIMEKKVKDLNDDDVLALELMNDDIKEKLGLSNRKTFFNIELKGLKENAEKHGIKKIFVSEYLPRFVPYIFISLALNLLLGDVFLWLLDLQVPLF